MTLIIGSVVYLKPTEVPRVPFTRDLVFLVLALLLILISASIGSVSVREVSVLAAHSWSVFCLKGPGLSVSFFVWYVKRMLHTGCGCCWCE